jgi:hypothetical protein
MKVERTVAFPRQSRAHARGDTPDLTISAAAQRRAGHARLDLSQCQPLARYHAVVITTEGVMNSHISPAKAGLTLGAVLGGWHLTWSVLVALGLAQSVADFIFWMHFIKPVYVIENFDIARAGILVVVTALVGFVLGAVFAWVWNAAHRT